MLLNFNTLTIQGHTYDVDFFNDWRPNRNGAKGPAGAIAIALPIQLDWPNINLFTEGRCKQLIQGIIC